MEHFRLMGTKCGMVQRFAEDGSAVACTLIQFDPNVICQIKSLDTDGYAALQLGTGSIRPKNVSKPLQGHFAKASVAVKRRLGEMRVAKTEEFAVGQELTVELFEGVSFVDVQSVSKGKGYQGVMKLHGFAGGPAAHGSGFHRHAGSIGMRSTPGRCLPGGKRASRMGGDLKTVQSLKVVLVDKERGLILVKGAIPGAKGAFVVVQPAVKRKKKVAAKKK